MGTCETRWKAWEGDEILPLDFPSNWTIESFDIGTVAPMTTAQLQVSFDHPVGVGPIEDRFLKRGRVCIAVEDLTRPLYIGHVLEVLTERLLRLGFREEDIRIMVSVGAHHPMLRPEQLRKFGERIVSRFAIENHHPYVDLKDCGISQRGTPVKINRTFLEADYRVLLGSVLPHPYTGFGGGAKLLIPGLAGMETIEATHRAAVGGVSGGLDNTDTNQVRAEIEDLAQKIGIDWSINLIAGRNRNLVGCVAGDVVKAHRQAVQIARALYATSPPSQPFDVVVLNAYPKDTEMLQIGNALNVVKSGPGADRLIGPEGSVVILGACSHGRGYHSLHQPGGSVYRPPVQRVQQIGKRDILFLSAGANIHDFHMSFWQGYRFYTQWSELRHALQTKHGDAARAAVYHAAPLQLLRS